MTLTVGSLFSGIGGLELGLEACGMEVRWQVEKDAYCREALARHWPTVPRYEDVHDVGIRNLEWVDLICGGFPCQDISHAGRRAGIIKGFNRSGLWGEFERIVRELRPRFVLVENVSALTVRGLDVVLADLAALGFDAEWDCIPASYIGAPHRRDRVWVVGYARGEPFDWLHDLRRAARGYQAGRESLDANDASGARALANSSREHLEKRVDNGGADARRAYGEPAGSGARMADADSLGRRQQQQIEGGDGARARDESRGRGEDVPDAERPRLEGYAGNDGEAIERARAAGSVAARDSSGGATAPVADASSDGRGESAERTSGDGRQPERLSSARGEYASFSNWTTEPDAGRVADGISTHMDRLAGVPLLPASPHPKRKAAGRVHRLKALGNAVVPQAGEWIGWQIRRAIGDV